MGGYGRFDKTCAKYLKELKTTYPHIQITLVLAYLRNNLTDDEQEYIADTYTNTIYPPIEKVPKKFAISKRNEWIVLNSDYIIFYVNQQWGGANNMLKYANRKKHIANQYAFTIKSLIIWDKQVN